MLRGYVIIVDSIPPSASGEQHSDSIGNCIEMEFRQFVNSQRGIGNAFGQDCAFVRVSDPRHGEVSCGQDYGRHVLQMRIFEQLSESFTSTPASNP